MTRTAFPALVLLTVLGPALGQPKKKEETVTKEWVAQTAALPAAQQVEAVRAKLQELFGPHVTFKTAEIKDGAVTAVEIAGMQYVSDVGPVAAFKKLDRLVMAGDPVRGQVQDLTPLKSLPLKYLDCSVNAVASLEPLRGMPLEVLKCQSQNLKKPPDDWLAPVTSLKGLKELRCAGVRVHPLGGSGLKLEVLAANFCVWPKAGVGILRGMPLRELAASAASTIDPAVLRGQPVAGSPGDVAALKTFTGLEVLALIENRGVVSLDWAKSLPRLRKLSVDASGVTAFDPLKGARALTHLSANETQVASLEPLRSLKLTHLGLDNSRVTDLGPLDKMPLDVLTLGGVKVRNLKPLANLPLKHLGLTASTIEDLSPIASLKLTHLWIDKTAVKSLAPVRGMPLQYLNLNETPITDLSPLRGMPLTNLHLGKSPARDFAVLTTLDQLNDVGCDLKTPGLIPALRQVKALKSINGQPAADLLK